MKSNNMIGQKFNRLTVLYRVYPNTKSGNTRWHCKCDCGNECDVVGTNLRTGHTTSCGCKVKENMSKIGSIQGKNNCENLNGQTFGLLTVVERIYDQDQHKYKCLCQCECGGRVLVDADKLKSGHTKSCGCITSYGEMSINKYLTNKNINFKSQVTFKDLQGKANRVLRFDFGLYDDNNNLLALLEYNGKQHYDKNSNYYSEEAIKRDQKKNKYCNDKKIPLYIIKYNENLIKKLNTILEEVYNYEAH